MEIKKRDGKGVDIAQPSKTWWTRFMTRNNLSGRKARQLHSSRKFATTTEDFNNYMAMFKVIACRVTRVNTTHFAK